MGSSIVVGHQLSRPAIGGIFTDQGSNPCLLHWQADSLLLSQHSQGDQPWDFFGRNDAKANSSTLGTSCEELTHWKRL